MVRGCKKSIVYVKNTGSEYFKEAYFILNENKGLSIICEKDLVSEAKRIISDGTKEKAKKDKGVLALVKKNAAPFLVGMSVGIIALIISVII